MPMNRVWCSDGTVELRDLDDVLQIIQLDILMHERQHLAGKVVMEELGEDESVPLIGNVDKCILREETSSSNADETCATSELEDAVFPRKRGCSIHEIVGEDLANSGRINL